MKPAPSIQHHPTFEILSDYATAGCPVDCRPDWLHEHITATIAQGPHLSAKNPAAAASVWAKTMEKVAQGYAQIVQLDAIKHNLPKTLKSSPNMAVPHKSPCFAPSWTCPSNYNFMANAWQVSMKTPTPSQITRPWNNWAKSSGKL